MAILTRLALLGGFAVAIGTLASLAALAFVSLVGVFNDWLLISPRSRMMANNPLLSSVATVIVPAIGGLLVGLIWLCIKDRRPLGPPDAILSVHTADGELSTRGGLLTTLGSVISLGCGASVGQYGPLVLLGSTIGSRLAKLLGTALGKNPGVIGIGCGAAAAIATAFNAPIAGLVFAHEVILRHYSIKAFAPVAVAATIGYVMANVIFDQPPLFRLDDVSLGAPGEYLIFVVIGVVGSLLAILFMRAVLLSSAVAKRLSIPGYLKPALAGTLLGVIALWQPEILGIGSELLRFSTIDGAFTSSELALLIGLKIIVTALCIGFGFAGGVFSPALLIGALYGALVGSIATQVASTYFQIDLSPIALYAVCGMVSVTSPVIGAPLTTILIVFELTRNYDLAMACMASVVFANLLGYRLFGRSLFDQQLASRGVDLSLGRDKAILEINLLQDYMSQEYTRMPDNASMQEVMNELIATNRTEAYIVDSLGRYHGTIGTIGLLKWQQKGQLATASVAQAAIKEALVLNTDTSIWQAMKSVEGYVGESIPVVDENDQGKLVGVVYEAVLVKAYLDLIQAVREEEHAKI